MSTRRISLIAGVAAGIAVVGLAWLVRRATRGIPAPAQAANKAGIEWVTIPGGSFTLGSDSSLKDEGPAHSVAIKSFELAKTLVTNKQYKACVAAGACTAAHVVDEECYVYPLSTTNWGRLPDSFLGDEEPAVCVDWNQAEAFSKWVGGRLPSEAEWEYAARSAGKDRKYPWGNEDATCERAVINEGGAGCGRNATWPVCSKPKGNTEQGLCDMTGNAAEWVRDWYHESYNGAPRDGGARESPAGTTRVSRGGFWYGIDGVARLGFRSSGNPGDGANTVGFRPARSR